MSCQSHGCTVSLETDRILKCSVEGCEEAFCVGCFEKLTAELGKEDHEFFFLCEGSDGTCGVEAVWECQEETIAYCDNCFKGEHKGRRKSHSKIGLQRKRLKCEESATLNVFDSVCFGEMRHEIVMADEENKWMQISAENWNRFKQEARDEYSPVISFIGSTGTGKSFLVSSFVGDDKSSPSVAPINQKGSTSANINLFHAPGYDTDEFSFRRLLLLDCEGDGGTVPEMLRQRWLPLQNKLSKKLNLSLSQNRTHVVREEFPRFAYLTSDVIVFLETVDFTRIQDYLAKFQKFIDATQKGVLSASTPSLLIIQNKVDPVAVANRLSVSEATEDFFNLAFPFCKNNQKTMRRRSGAEMQTDMDDEDDDVIGAFSDDSETETEMSQDQMPSSPLVTSEPLTPDTAFRKKSKKESEKPSSKSTRKSSSRRGKHSRKSSVSTPTEDGQEEDKPAKKKKSGSTRKKKLRSTDPTGETIKKKKKRRGKDSDLHGDIPQSNSVDQIPMPAPIKGDTAENLGEVGSPLLNRDAKKELTPPRTPPVSVPAHAELKRGNSTDRTRSPPFRIMSPKMKMSDDSVPGRALTMLQGVEKGVTGRLPTAMAERVEKVSSNVKGSVGGVADRVHGKVRQMGTVLENTDLIRGKMRMENAQMSEEDRIKDDKRRRREFLNSFEMIRCVRIPNYRYVGSIEPYLKAFRDEVKKMINHHAAQKLKKGTNYSESIWLEITKELVQSCTSFSDSNVGIRMAQIVGKVMQPASGEELSTSIYHFFNLLLNEDVSKEHFISVRTSTEEYLALILANQLRKTGTKIESRKLIEDPKHPFRASCARMFESGTEAISGLTPCEFKSRKEPCTQLKKDHGNLHRFPGGKKKSGTLSFEEPEGLTLEEREKNFTTSVYEFLKTFHQDVLESIRMRIEALSRLEKPPIMKGKSVSAELSRCLLCFSNAHDTLLRCRHSFCKHCMKEAEEFGMESLRCPLCCEPMQLMVDKYKIPGRAGYRILSLDGGGIKGIIELVVLNKIMDHFPGCYPYQLFDLIVGTSTGAIISAAIGLSKRSADDALELYKQFPARVFRKRTVTNVNVLKIAYLLMGGKHLYRIADLENILFDLLQMDCDFIETINDSTTPKVALVSTNYSDNPMHPTLFCNYTPNIGNTSQYEHIEYCSTCKIHQGMTASAAAPIFFSPYSIDNTLYVDGALSANNPTELAVNEGLHLWPDRELDMVLSLGTGIPPLGTVSDSLFSWASTLAAQATDPNVVHQREKLKFNRIREEKGGLIDRIYYRFNPMEVNVDLDSTSAKALEQLVVHTLEYLEEPAVEKEFRELIQSILAKSYYISSEIDFVPVGAEKVKVSFNIHRRVAVESQHLGFLFDYKPQGGNFPPVDKTYDEASEDGASHRISFVAPPGASYEVTIRLVVGPNDPPLHISGSPFTLVCRPFSLSSS